MSDNHIAPNAKLQARGIYEASQAMHWQAVSNGWEYPIFAPNGQVVTKRWKALDSQAKPKYRWIPNKPTGCEYYLPHALENAIKEASGVLFIASGEVDLLTFLSAGFQNVLSWFGETSVPRSLSNDLHALGVQRVLMYPDRDKAGFESAIKVSTALRGTGIDFQAYDLPDIVGHKGDTNDLWQAVRFDVQAFSQALTDCKPLPLPLPATPKTDFRAQDLVFDSDYERALELWKHAIGERLEGNKRLVGSWLRGVLCPFHEDNHPSAGFNIDSGALHCFVCGTHGHKELANKLGLDLPRRAKAKRSAKKAESTDIQALAYPVPLERFNAHERVNVPYISELAPQIAHHHTLAIKSPIATGKTELIKRLMVEFELSHKRACNVLFVTHRESLAVNASERLGIENYKAIPTEYRDKAPSMAICYDSLDTAPLQVDLLVLDEFDQLLAHALDSSTHDGKTAELWQALSARIDKAYKLVALDAHLSNVGLGLLEDFRGQAHAIENEYRHQWGNITIEADYSTQIAHALTLATMTDTKGVLITSNSRDLGERIAELARNRGILESEIFVVNGYTGSSLEAQKITQKLTSSKASMREVTGLRLLIVSPTYGTGLDVQTPVSGVYGIFYNSTWIDANKILQQLMRFRRSDYRSISIHGGQKRDNPELTDWKAINHQQMRRAQLTAFEADFSAYGVETGNKALWLISELTSKYQALGAIQRNSLFAYVVACATAEGFNVTFANEMDKAIKEGLKEARQALADKQKADTLASVAIPYETYEALRQTSPLLKELTRARLGVLRFEIEALTGKGLSPSLYDTLHKPSERSKLNRFVDLLDTWENLKAHDRGQASNQKTWAKRGHYTVSRQLIEGALKTVWGDSWAQSTEELTAQELETRFTYYRDENAVKIRTHLDNGRDDLSQDPVAMLRRIVGKAGIKIEGRQVRIEGERHYVYSIAHETLKVWIDLAKEALQARLNRLSQNAVLLPSQRVLRQHETAFNLSGAGRAGGLNLDDRRQTVPLAP